MTKLPMNEVRAHLADALNRVAYGKERLLVHRRGKPLAALVPVEDLETIERLEDEIDTREADKAMRAYRKSPKSAVALGRVRRRIGLK
jgi:prevent-host-death family protein